MKLAVPDLISNSYFPAVAAVDLGFFKAEGLDVDACLQRAVVTASFALETWGSDGLLGATRADAEARCPKGAIVLQPDRDDVHVRWHVIWWWRISEKKPVHCRIPAARLKKESHPPRPGAKPGDQDAYARERVRHGAIIDLRR